MTITGTPTPASAICFNTPATVIPPSSAVWVARWMVGPSASGSLKGIPTSMKSAPVRATAWMAASDRAGVGNPAVRYGIRADRCSPRTARQRAAMGRSDKVVADVQAVLEGIGDLHDTAREIALLVALGQVREDARLDQGAVGARDDAHHRAVHLAHVRVGRVHQRHFVGVE